MISPPAPGAAGSPTRRPTGPSCSTWPAGDGIQETLRTPWPGFSLRRLPPPKDLCLEVGWTGSPASTSSLVVGLHRRAWRGSASHQKFMETSADIVRAAVTALEAG